MDVDNLGPVELAGGGLAILVVAALIVLAIVLIVRD